MFVCIAVAKKLAEYTPENRLFGEGYRVKVVIPEPIESEVGTAVMAHVNAEPAQFRLSYRELYSVADALTEWYALVLDQSFETEGRYAFHRDLHLGNVLVNKESHSIYIIDPSPNAVESSEITAWLDFQHYLMSTALSVFPRYGQFTSLGRIFLDRVETKLKYPVGLRSQLYTQLLLLKSVAKKAVKQRKFADLLRCSFASVYIFLFLVIRKFGKSDTRMKGGDACE